VEVLDAVSAVLELFVAQKAWRLCPELHVSCDTVESQFPHQDNVIPASVLQRLEKDRSFNLAMTVGIARYGPAIANLR
jgi:hypothetical protein